MAVSTQGYDSQVAPGGLDTAPVQASPDAFGAGVGASVDQLAGTIQKLRADQQISSFSSAFAKQRAQNDQDALDLQKSVPAGGDGYHATVVSNLDTQGQTLLAGITDPQARRQAQSQWDSYSAEQGARAYEWQAGAAVGKTLSDAQTVLNTGADRVMTQGDQAYADETGHWHDYVHGLTNIGEADKAKLLKSGDTQYSLAQIDNLKNTNPQAAITTIDAGAFDGVLSPEQLQTARQGAEAQVRRLAAQQREAASQQKAQVTSAIGQVRAQQDAGIVVPDAQLNSLQAQAGVVGLDKDEFDVGVMRAHNNLNTETQSWKPQQFDAEIERLQAAGPNASAADQIRLHQLQAIAPARIAAFKDNPGGFAAANGAPPPAVDPDDTSTFAARAQWRQGVQTSTGTWTPTLSKDEAQPWQEMVQHGTPADKMRAAQWINQWGGEAPNVLRQLEPNRDSAFAQAVAMGSSNSASMRDALNGPAAKAAMGGDGKLFAVDPAQLPTAIAATGQAVPSGATPEQMKSMVSPDALFGLGARGALQARGAQFAQGVRENADNIYASTAQANGWNTYHPGEYLRSVQKAAGGVEVQPNVWRGGFGAYNGQSVLLPSTMTQDDFAHTLSRAAPEDFAHAATQGEGAPVYAGGHPVTAGELKAATPVALGGGHYMFKVGNTAIRATHGGNYVIDVTRLPRR
jgi:hypothetical protein